MTQWYLLHCKARQEARAKQHIENQGYKTCLPTIKIKKTVRGKRQIIDEVLFPSYLFIEVDMESGNFNSIRSTRGVNNFVRFGGVPSKIPPKIVQHLQELERPSGKVEEAYQPGMSVEIVAGPFTGLEAVFSMSKGEDRCLVLLEMMGKQQLLEIEEAKLTKH